MDPWGKNGYNRLVTFPVGREPISGGHLTSKSTKDCAMTKRDKVGREIPRVPTRISLTTGPVDNADLISAHAFEGLPNGERLRMARAIIIRQGRTPNKSNVRKMARYGIGLAR